jgi:probable F420-dependent oxidoreductase
MKVGVYYFPTDYGINIAELAGALEQRGFESLFVCEHTHIPVSRRSPFPGGGELPKRYKHTHDPFVALSFAAAVTKKLKLGTGICLIPQHDPIVTAKSVASLDQLSGGRFILAMGGGWNVEEMENHGAKYDTRFKLLRERALATKELWTKEEAEFHGAFVNFDKVWSYPKPTQRPHPPLFLGGESDHTLKRVVEFCDGWFPRGRNAADAGPILAGLDRLGVLARQAGRDPKAISTSVFGARPDAPVLDGYRAAGVTRAVFRLPPEGRDRILPLLDQYAKLIPCRPSSWTRSPSVSIPRRFAPSRITRGGRRARPPTGRGGSRTRSSPWPPSCGRAPSTGGSPWRPPFAMGSSSRVGSGSTSQASGSTGARSRRSSRPW